MEDKMSNVIKLNKYEDAILRHIEESENWFNQVGQAIYHNNQTDFKEIVRKVGNWASFEQDGDYFDVDYNKNYRLISAKKIWIKITNFWGPMMWPQSTNVGQAYCCTVADYFTSDGDLKSFTCKDYNDPSNKFWDERLTWENK
jgi:hypothetical protein